MNNFQGYWLKVGNVIFNNPSPKRDTFKFAPKLVQVGDSEVVASGKLSIKVLPHDRSKLWFELPPMTPEQARVYRNALYGDAGGHGMYITVTAYDITTDQYITDTYYHTDVMWRPIWLGGQWMVQLEPVDLIGH